MAWWCEIPENKGYFLGDNTILNGPLIEAWGDLATAL